MDWTDELEKQIKYIGDCARGYVWMYNREHLKLAKTYYYLSNLSVGLGFVAGILVVISLGLGVEQTKEALAISSLFSFSTSIFEIFLRKYEFETTMENCKRQGSKYNGIVNNVRRQLGLQSSQREKAGDYARWISHSYEELRDKSGEISPEIIKEYRQVALDEKLPFPEEGNADANIIIHIQQASPPDVNTSPVEKRVSPTASDYSDAQMKYELSRMAENNT